MQSFLHSVGEAITPVLKNSKFQDTGVLTPEEFVAAGDFLVYKCPTWSWASGEEKLRRPFLPADKQYLITKNVPCFKRVKSVMYTDDDEALVDGGDTGDWVDTFHSQHKSGMEEELRDMSVSEPITVHAASSDESDDDDIPDIDEFVDDNLEEEDGAVATREEDNILKTRTYDLSITYDKYYQTPRLWLFGYDEHRRPLTQKEMFEDFSQDHAKKTVTMETHPHLPATMASIHPCRHANVMKRIIDNLALKGKDELQVHMYIMIFLKFVSAVIPTIEYDYTREFTM